MSYKNITIINKDGNKYHPETNISNVLGIDKKADKNYVDEKLNNKADIEYVDEIIEDAEAINTTLQNAITSSKISKEKLEEENKRSESNIVTISGLNKNTVALIDDLKSTSEYANLNKQQLGRVMAMAEAVNIELLESITNADLDGINQAIKDLKDDILDKANKDDLLVHLEEDITEDMVVTDFKNGLTISALYDKEHFPSVYKFGVVLTFINKRHGGYGQIIITSIGDIWSRRTNKLNSWGPWFNTKRGLDVKADKSELDKVKQSGVEINKILVDALNSKDISASTSDSIRDNVKKVEDIEANYDWKIKNLLHYSNFNNGWYKWQGNQSATLKTTDDNGVKVTFNQTNSTPGMRRAEADIFLDKSTKTLSFLVKHSNPSNSTIAYFFDGNGEKIIEGPRLTTYKEKGYTKYIMTFSLPSADKYQLMILTNSPKSKDDYMVIKDIMIENGKEANIYRPFILQNHDYREVKSPIILTNEGESKRFSPGYYGENFNVQCKINNLYSWNIKKGITVGGKKGTYDPTPGIREVNFYWPDLAKSGRQTRYFSIPAGYTKEDLRGAILRGGDKSRSRWGEYDVLTGAKYPGTSDWHLEGVEMITNSKGEDVLKVTLYGWEEDMPLTLSLLEPYIKD